ncbi:hypothetical protein AKJ09_05859 [Labilithrix luteola]|uniref:Uncharacterized protein n=1 Tax=Labilithrix luteola TaxID=1391654 RepID=A0A0K1Q086_9BACT|nr:hypothetical protein [Labilithrix luteola]AKU99195.1 hypothetical protein AKJ09_05859 [Labilithrix luteola]
MPRAEGSPAPPALAARIAQIPSVASDGPDDNAEEVSLDGRMELGWRSR